MKERTWKIAEVGVLAVTAPVWLPPMIIICIAMPVPGGIALACRRVVTLIERCLPEENADA